MHINYREMLPASKSCDHLSVDWEINEPKGQTYVLVNVACKSCPASVSNQRVEKDR